MVHLLKVNHKLGQFVIGSTAAVFFLVLSMQKNFIIYCIPVFFQGRPLPGSKS